MSGIVSNLRNPTATPPSSDAGSARPIEPPDAVTSHPFLRRQLDRFSRLTATPLGPVREPLLVREAEVVSALYLVDADVAQALVENSPGVERAPAPWVRVLRLPFTGQALVLFSMLQYKRGTLDPYCEIAIQVLAHIEGQERQLGRDLLAAMAFGVPQFLWQGLVSMDALFAYVLALPVSTEQSLRVGQGLYNSPKYLSPISMQRSGQSVTIEDGCGVVIRVPPCSSRSLPMMPFPAIGTNAPDRDGVLSCKIAVPASSSLRYSLSGRLQIDVSPSAETTLASTIKTLRLDEQPPRLLMQDESFTVAFLPAVHRPAGGAHRA